MHRRVWSCANAACDCCASEDRCKARSTVNSAKHSRQTLARNRYASCLRFGDQKPIFVRNQVGSKSPVSGLWSEFRNVRGLAGHHRAGELLALVEIDLADSFQLPVHEFHEWGKCGMAVGAVASTPAGSA